MISAKDVFTQLTTGPSIMDSICNFIIRPQRSAYEMDDLGPEVFRIGDEGKDRFMRHDFELQNMRGLTFQCSWFKPYPTRCVPCVVYCHANCGGRYDALEALFVLREGFSLFCFDFCGSGMSEGEYISLGFYERQDLAAVTEFLMLKSDEVDGVALWGRSMGAVTSIMYAAKDPWIRCIVCDSPFANLRLLINDLVERHGGRTARVIPNAIVSAVVERIRRRIVKRATFDIDDLNTVKYAAQCHVPALLFHGSEDDFVSTKHCEMIRDAFPSPCLQQYTPGGHNDDREEEIQTVIAAFLHLYLIDKPAGARELQAQRKAAAAGKATAVSSPPFSLPFPTAAASSNADERYHEGVVSALPPTPPSAASSSHRAISNTSHVETTSATTSAASSSASTSPLLATAALLEPPAPAAAAAAVESMKDAAPPSISKPNTSSSTIDNNDGSPTTHAARSSGISTATVTPRS